MARSFTSHSPRKIFAGKQRKLSKPKYKVKFVTRIGDGTYGGMNFFAAKDLGYKFPHRKTTVTILAGQTKKKTEDTIKHETQEAELMRTTGMPYRQAHRQITKQERKK